jgi:PHD/YefM family antitoxin component YafN of YafNO toxin-antitoxin module
MARVSASEVQKNFGEWHDKAYEQPVEITRYGRTTAFLVSATMYRDMMASYRKAIPVTALDDHELHLIRNAVVETDRPYNLSDLPDDEDSSAVKPL